MSACLRQVDVHVLVLFIGAAMTSHTIRVMFRAGAMLPVMWLFSLNSSAVLAAVIPLYSGAGLPATQAWLDFASDASVSLGTAVQTPVAAGVQLSTDVVVKAGYSNYLVNQQLKNPAFPALDRLAGYELALDLGVQSENHALNPNRAGFSLTLLSADLRGIELGFWTDRIQAQGDSPLFQFGEGVMTSTVAQQSYRLRVQGNSYRLFQGGVQVLTGALRDYSAFAGPINPYVLPNFLFLGDNTASAAATVSLGPIVLESDLTAVPEPGVTVLLAAVAIVLIARPGRKLLEKRPV